MKQKNRKKPWKPTIYLAQPMSGCSWKKARKRAWQFVRLARKYGIRVVSPVLQEPIPKSQDGKYIVTKRLIDHEWDLDKHARLSRCHGLYAVPGNVFSNGVTIERGRTRWFLWRKVISYVPKQQYFYSITAIEEDGIAHSDIQAIKMFKKQIGTRKKWIKWKLKHLLFDVPKFIWIQVKSIWL